MQANVIDKPIPDFKKQYAGGKFIPFSEHAFPVRLEIAESYQHFQRVIDRFNSAASVKAAIATRSRAYNPFSLMGKR